MIGESEKEEGTEVLAGGGARCSPQRHIGHWLSPECSYSTHTHKHTHTPVSSVSCKPKSVAHFHLNAHFVSSAHL